MKNVNIIGVVALVILDLGCSGSSLSARGAGGTAAGGKGGQAGGTGTGSAGSVAGGGTTAARPGGAGSTASVPKDGGVVLDAAPDACLVVLACDLLPSCPIGKRRMERPCACPVCIPDDPGPPDAPQCPLSCPPLQCPYGSVRDPVCDCWTCIEPDAGVGKDTATGKDSSSDACLHLPCPLVVCPAGTRSVDHECACPTCEPVDAGTETGKPACLGLDTCTCYSTRGCSVLTDSCWCPAPECVAGACICGGGTVIGCVPTELNSCAAAKARVAGLCPTLLGATFDGICQKTDSACVTKCFNEVSSCKDVSCTFCEDCSCAADAFARCRATCQNLISR